MSAAYQGETTHMPHLTFRVRCFALLSFLMWGCSGPEVEDTPPAPASEARPSPEAPASTSQALEGNGAAPLLPYTSSALYSHMTWHPVGPRTAEFTVLASFSRYFYSGSGPDGRVVTGDVFTGPWGYLRFGDDPSEFMGSLTYEAIDHNLDEGWVMARAILPPGERPLPGTGVTVPDIEPNNSLDTALPMNMGDDATSELTSWQEPDTFRFTLEAPKKIRVRLVTDSLPQADVVLLSSSGQQLGSSGASAWQSIELTLQPGTYYLRTYAGMGYSGQLTVQLRELGPRPAEPITHTYPGLGPYTASFEFSGYSANASVVRSPVRFDLPDSSPVSTLPPFLTAPAYSSAFTFQIPATDAEGDALTFRLASGGESGLDNLPPGLSVSSSGLLAWDTTGLAYERESPAAIVIEEHRDGQKIGSSAVLFMLRIGASQPPVCSLPQTDYTVSPSEVLKFSITGSDPDAGELLDMSGGGEPTDDTFQIRGWPNKSNPVIADYTWKPSSSWVGRHVRISFSVMDQSGNHAECETMVHVVAQPTHPLPVANAGPDQSVSEGSRVMLDGRGSSAPEGEALTYEWIPSGNADGLLSSTTSPTPVFTPPQNGTYTFTLIVTDSRGITSTDSVTVFVANVVPIVEAHGGAVAPGTSFRSIGSIIDPGADTFTVTINFGDGPEQWVAGVFKNTFLMDHVYAESGTYPVTITVDDGDGGVATATVQMVVTESAPAVMVNGGSADEGSLFTESGSFSATGGTSWTATVNYGDGTGWQPLALDGQAFLLSHAYADDGLYSVSVRVTDDTGLTGSGLAMVQVLNVAPQVSVPSISVDEGETFTTTVTVQDPGADHWMARVEYGDWSGEWVNVNADGTFTISHRYTYPGSYALWIQVIDDEWGEGWLQTTVEVRNIPPVVKLSTLAPAFEGTWWLGSGTIGTSDEFPYFYATVDYGDGSGPQQLNTYYSDFWLYHRYEENGVYTVTVTVDEGDGTLTTVSGEVVVQNVAPQLSYSQPGSPSADEGAETYLPFTIEDVDADTLTASIDYGDGTSEQFVPWGRYLESHHVYANSGTYTVTVTATDDDGGTSTFRVLVNVWNVTPYVDLGWGAVGYEGTPLITQGWFYDPGAETGWTAMADFGDGTGLHPVTFTPDSYDSKRYWLELNHTYAQDGDYMVTTYVTDADGGVGTYVSWTRIENVDPQISVPEQAAADEGSLFTATGSFVDPGSDTWTATVDYGDGSGPQPLELEGNTFTLSHVYTFPGWYSVWIIIQDGSNYSWGGYAWFGVEVRNGVPVVSAEGGTLTQGSVFSTTGTFTDPGTADWWVAVDYGDGSDWEGVSPNGKTFQLSHVYEQPGTYTVTIEVGDGWDVGRTTVQVVVLRPPPVVSLEGAEGPEMSWFSLEGSISGAAMPWTARVDYGDGSGEQQLTFYGSMFTLGHGYKDNGTYSVTIHVQDALGGVATATAQVVVHNLAPTVTASSSGPVYWGVPVQFSGTVLDPSATDTAAGFTTGWAFGDGTTASGLSQVHAYAAPGSYMAVLTASDKDGASASASTSVGVLKRPSSLTCSGTSSVFGFPARLSARLADALPGAQLGGKALVFRIGSATVAGSGTTGSDGSASLLGPGSLAPGQYTVTVSFAEDSHYTGAQAQCSLTVEGSDGTLSGKGLRLANKAKAEFKVKVDKHGQLEGELEFKSESTSFKARTVASLGISADSRSAWFSGTGKDGRSFMAHAVAGTENTGGVFQLWIDGQLQTGDGSLRDGKIQIHGNEELALAQ